MQGSIGGTRRLFIGQTPKSDIPPNIAPKIVTPKNYLQIWDSSATLISHLAIVTLFGAILGGIPLSGPYPFFIPGWESTAGLIDGKGLCAHYVCAS